MQVGQESERLQPMESVHADSPTCWVLTTPWQAGRAGRCRKVQGPSLLASLLQHLRPDGPVPPTLPHPGLPYPPAPSSSALGSASGLQVQTHTHSSQIQTIRGPAQPLRLTPRQTDGKPSPPFLLRTRPCPGGSPCPRLQAPPSPPPQTCGSPAHNPPHALPCCPKSCSGHPTAGGRWPYCQEALEPGMARWLWLESNCFYWKIRG